MAYIKEKVVPKREERLGASNVFGGRICNLVGDSKKGCLVNKNRSFSQTCNCQLGLALTMVTTFPDAALILHGPVGCGSQLHGSASYRKTGQT
ncbi:MAG: nitrogenase, partial [Chloroflexota bacterium]